MKNRRLLVSVVAGLTALTLILSLIFMLVPQQASAATSSEIKDQIEEMEKDQAALQKELNELEKKRKENLTAMQDIIDEKNIVDQQVALLHEQIDSINDQVAAYAVMIADKQAELDRANQDLQELKQKHMERLRAMEEDGSLSYWSVIFEASSFTDLLDRLNMIQEIAAADQKRIEEMGVAAEKVEQTRLLLQQEQVALQDSRHKLAAKEVELARKAEESEKLLASLIARGEEFEKWMDEQEDKLADLENDLLEMESEYDRVKYEEWLATSVPPTTNAAPPQTPTAPPEGNSTVIWRSGKALTASTVNGVTTGSPVHLVCVSTPFITTGKCTTAWTLLSDIRPSMPPGQVW